MIAMTLLTLVANHPAALLFAGGMAAGLALAGYGL